MDSVPFHLLDPGKHNGRSVRIGDRTGRLAWCRNPQYKRIDVWEWYLIIPDARFGEVAMTTYIIQPDATVWLLDFPAEPVQDPAE